PRKNRDGVIRIFARTKDKWNGRLVFAGDALDAELLSLTKELGVSDRVVQIKDPSSELLEALYNCAVALLFPSRSETREQRRNCKAPQAAHWMDLIFGQ